MPNRTEARPAKAALYDATGRLPLLRLFSTPLIASAFWTWGGYSRAGFAPKSADSD
jgi:hypothetical protein